MLIHRLQQPPGSSRVFPLFKLCHCHAKHFTYSCLPSSTPLEIQHQFLHWLHRFIHAENKLSKFSCWITVPWEFLLVAPPQIFKAQNSISWWNITFKMSHYVLTAFTYVAKIKSPVTQIPEQCPQTASIQTHHVMWGSSYWSILLLILNFLSLFPKLVIYWNKLLNNYCLENK